MRLSRDGMSVFGFGSHFQYVTTKAVIREVGPLPVAACGLDNQERVWDERVRELGYFRLALITPYVRHLGNTLEGEDVDALAQVAGTARQPTRVRQLSPLSNWTRLFLLLMRVKLSRRLVVRLQRHMYEATRIWRRPDQ